MSKLWVFHHEILNFICIQVASFTNFFNCLMYGADKRSRIITHLLINIFFSQLLLSLFNIIIPIPDNNRRALINTFYNNVFVIFQIIKFTPLLYLFYRISMFISFSSKLLKFISIAASLFLGSKVDFGLNLFRSNSFSSFQKCHFERNILRYASSSILSFALLIWLLVGTNFNPLYNNEISALVSFRLDKLTAFLQTNLL